MSKPSTDRGKWAMVPESLIVGELLPGISSQLSATALRLYCYLDLRQGDRGWPVKGFRRVATATGLQERSVSRAAKVLAEAGLIELTLTTPVATSAVMKVIHNPARGRIHLGKRDQQVKTSDVVEGFTPDSSGEVEFTTEYADCDHTKKDKDEDHPGNGQEKNNKGEESGRPDSPGNSGNAPGRNK